MEPLWAEIIRLHVPLCLQVNVAHAKAVAVLAERQPELTLIVDYLGSEAFRHPSPASFLRTLAARDNVLCKVLLVAQDSREPWPYGDLLPFYREVVDAFGASRLIYGAEFPYVLAYTMYERAMHWLDTWPFLSQGEREAILDGTARRVWPPPATQI